MNGILVVMYHDNTAPREGALFWGAKNQQYLADYCSKTGFDLFYVLDGGEGLSEGSELPIFGSQPAKVICEKEIKSELERTGSRGLLFINDRTVISDQIALKELIDKTIVSGVPGFTLNELVHYVDKMDYEGFDLNSGQLLNSENLARQTGSMITDARRPEGYHFALTRYRKDIVEKHMRTGVVFLDPDNTYIGYYVEIGPDTLIYPGCMLEGRSVIGAKAIIGPDTMIKDSEIGNGTMAIKSVINDSKVGENCNIGPFAYIRPGCVLQNHVKVGDFVELKNSEIGEKTKIPHLTYIGDSSVGGNTNVGCGVITANYDGKRKHRTVIGNNAFVGCNVTLVAPVTIHDGAYIAAGSTITQEVPANALAIARERQTVKEEWVIKKGLQRTETKGKKYEREF